MNPQPKPSKRIKERRRLSRELVQHVFEKYNYQCQYCMVIFPPGDHGLDCQLHAHHLKHVSQGGKDEIDNLKPACWACHAKHGWISKIDRCDLDIKKYINSKETK